MAYVGNLIVDIDGVLADTLTTALDWFNYQWGTRFIPTDINKYNPTLTIYDDSGIKSEISFADWMVVSIKDPDFHRDVKPFPGASKVLGEALMDGWEITLATARAPETSILTTQWLSWNEIPHHRLLHNANKYQLTGDLLIEDHLTNVMDWNGWFKGKNPLRAALLIDTPYNQSQWLPWPIHRVRDWVDIDVYLRDPEAQDGLHV